MMIVGAIGKKNLVALSDKELALISGAVDEDAHDLNHGEEYELSPSIRAIGSMKATQLQVLHDVLCKIIKSNPASDE